VPASWLGSARQTTPAGTLQAPRAVRDMQLRIQAAAAVADNAHLVQENRCLAEDNVLLQQQVCTCVPIVPTSHDADALGCCCSSPRSYQQGH
jgi:hypothetical protein